MTKRILEKSRNFSAHLKFSLLLLCVSLINQRGISQTDTLHLYYHYSQSTAPDTIVTKIENWAKSLNGRHVNMSIVAYYHKSEFKPAAVSRTEDLFLVLNRKARNLVTIGAMEPKKGKDYQRSMVDIVYTFADGKEAPKKEVAAIAPTKKDAAPAKESTSSQEKPKESRSEEKKTSSEDDDNFPNNVVKLNLFQLPTLNISGQYEFAFHNNISAALGLSYLVSRSVPSQFYSEGGTTGTALGFAGPSFKGFAITPEIRFYPFSNTKGGAPHGFYIAPYFRYAKYTISADYSAVVDATPVNFKYSMSYGGGTGGIMLGAQWLLGKHITLDWWILGGGYGRARVNLEASSTVVNMDADDQAAVKKTT